MHTCVRIKTPLWIVRVTKKIIINLLLRAHAESSHGLTHDSPLKA